MQPAPASGASHNPMIDDDEREAMLETLKLRAYLAPDPESRKRVADQIALLRRGQRVADAEAEREGL